MNIEELAFKDRRTLAQLNEIDLLDIIELLQADRKQWINQFSKTHNESVEIQKENQKLKKQLEEINKMIEKCGFANIEQVMLNYCGLLTQQKEFIKYLEDEVNKWRNNYDSYNYEYEIEEPTAEELVNEILQKYKTIIGVSDEKTN